MTDVVSNLPRFLGHPFDHTWPTSEKLASVGLSIYLISNTMIHGSEFDILVNFGTVGGFQPHAGRKCHPQKSSKRTGYLRLGTSVKDGRYLSLQEVLRNVLQARLYS